MPYRARSALWAGLLASKEMLDLLAETPVKRQPLLEGGGYAQLFGPDAKPLCEPLAETAEGILYVDVDLGFIGVAKAAYDPRATTRARTW